MLIAVQVISIISGIALIASVIMQTTKADSFSAAMGGGGADSTKFRPGSREYWLEKVTKTSAVVWLVSMFFGAVLWYHSR
jgi:protein translocase SecG subunit